jgi:hypothetical protein
LVSISVLALKIGVPVLFALMVFYGIDYDEPLPESFQSSIIATDGIFLGFTMLILTYGAKIGDKFQNALPPEMQNQSDVKEAIRELRDFIRDSTLEEWLNHFFPFTVSLVCSLAALTHAGIISTALSVSSFMLMAYGIMNLAYTITEFYPKP